MDRPAPPPRRNTVQLGSPTPQRAPPPLRGNPVPSPPSRHSTAPSPPARRNTAVAPPPMTSHPLGRAPVRGTRGGRGDFRGMRGQPVAGRSNMQRNPVPTMVALPNSQTNIKDARKVCFIILVHLQYFNQITSYCIIYNALYFLLLCIDLELCFL